MNRIVKKILKISGMHCTSCAMNIDFDLEDLEGVKSAKTNYVKQETEIEYDEENVNLGDVFKVIQKLGYEAVVKQDGK